MLNVTGKKYLAEYISYKDNTNDIIEILARFYFYLVNKLCSRFTKLLHRFYPIINGYKMFRL